MTTFSKRLREIRTDRNMTQQELGDKLGVSKSRISMYEIGQREPDFEMLEMIADFFNVDMSYLIGESDSNTSFIGSNDESILISLFRQLNEEGQYELLKQARILNSVEIYKKQQDTILSQEA